MDVPIQKLTYFLWRVLIQIYTTSHHFELYNLIAFILFDDEGPIEVTLLVLFLGGCALLERTLHR